MSEWIEGLPTESGIYWMLGELHGGGVAISLFRVELGSTPDSPPWPPPEGLPPKESLAYIQRWTDSWRLHWTRIDIQSCPTKLMDKRDTWGTLMHMKVEVPPVPDSHKKEVW